MGFFRYIEPEEIGERLEVKSQEDLEYIKKEELKEYMSIESKGLHPLDTGKWASNLDRIDTVDLNKQIRGYIINEAIIPINSHDIFKNIHFAYSCSYSNSKIRDLEKKRWGLAHNNCASIGEKPINHIESRRIHETIELINSNLKYIIYQHDTCNNYFHWTTEVIPRLMGLSKLFTRGTLEKVEFLIISNTTVNHNYLDQIRIILGFMPQIRYLNRGIRCNKLIWIEPIMPGWRCRSILKELRRKMMACYAQSSTTNDRILIVNRGRSRNKRDLSEKYINEINQMENVDIIESGKLTIKEQIELFSSYKYILGVHGAAFTNILYATEGSIVMEIGSNLYPDMPTAFLAKVAGINWSRILGEGESGRINSLPSYFNDKIENICKYIKLHE